MYTHKKRLKGKCYINEEVFSLNNKIDKISLDSFLRPFKSYEYEINVELFLEENSLSLRINCLDFSLSFLSHRLF